MQYQPVQLIVITLNGNSEIIAQVESYLGYLICLRHLFQIERGLKYEIFLFKNNCFSLHVRNEFWVTIFNKHHDSTINGQIIIQFHSPETSVINHVNKSNIYWVTQKLPQIYTANNATFPIRIRKIIVQICSNFWVTRILITSIISF